MSAELRTFAYLDHAGEQAEPSSDLAATVQKGAVLTGSLEELMLIGRGIMAGSGEDKAHQSTRSGTSAPSVSQPRVNTLSIVSLVLVAVAVAGSVFGGALVLAVFAVGAGHVALHQIKVRGERGAILAYIGIGISYLIATFALVDIVYVYFSR